MSVKKQSQLRHSVSDVLKGLWSAEFFVEEQDIDQIRKKLQNSGCNPNIHALQMALLREKCLTRRGSRGNYRYIQKFAAKKFLLNGDVFPIELVRVLEQDFKTELEDLRLNYGKSGICTAFLLRKILEKLIFLAFAKNGMEDKLKNASGDSVGLKTMLKMAIDCKIHGKPFLMPKTAKEIDGIKFLGDTSAHNPLTDVHMKTIIPVMPYIVTAYFELTKKL